MIQFVLMMTAVAAAFAVQHVGGLSVMVERLSGLLPGPDGQTMLHYLNLLPDFTNNWTSRWRCSSCRWRSNGGRPGTRGAEPGGGSYIAQRMLA